MKIVAEFGETLHTRYVNIVTCKVVFVTENNTVQYRLVVTLFLLSYSVSSSESSTRLMDLCPFFSSAQTSLWRARCGVFVTVSLFFFFFFRRRLLSAEPCRGNSPNPYNIIIIIRYYPPTSVTRRRSAEITMYRKKDHFPNGILSRLHAARACTFWLMTHV